MRKFLVLVCSVIALTFTSCTVTESIVFNEDMSGEYLVSYDMGEVMTQMGDMFKEGEDTETEEEEEKTSAGKVMDTMMVFSEIMEMHKDSVAALPEDRRLVLEALKDMYMKMHMDEDKGEFDFGVGMNFNSIDDLQGIQDKIKKAQSLNSQGQQADAMKENSPFGKFMGNDNVGMNYTLTENGFSRMTEYKLPEGADMEEFEQKLDELFDETDDSNEQFMAYFQEATYNVKYTFPKKVKSTTIEGATISEDGKTVTYHVNWIDYLKNPKSLDVDIEFVDE